MDWQPIDTAPKDGTPIILWPFTVRGYAIPQTGFWTELYGGVWYLPSVGHLNGTWKPTHWMPSPDPPTIEQTENYTCPTLRLTDYYE